VPLVVAATCRVLVCDKVGVCTFEDDSEASLDGDELLLGVSEVEFELSTLEDKVDLFVDDSDTEFDGVSFKESVSVASADCNLVGLHCSLMETVRLWAPVSLLDCSPVAEGVVVVEPEWGAERETECKRVRVGDGTRLFDADDAVDADGVTEGLCERD